MNVLIPVKWYSVFDLTVCELQSPARPSIFRPPLQRRYEVYPDSKVYGANMGPIWGQQDPGGPHVGPTNFVIWV